MPRIERPAIERPAIDIAIRRVLLDNVDPLVREFNLTPEEKQLFLDAQRAINKMREKPNMVELCGAFGFGCGGVTC
ncbi:MAG: hypothetical protein JXA33_20725 [Anaerolineae bacterium]|nr:hypothetical protein [Anaerolineae bacterium]